MLSLTILSTLFAVALACTDHEYQAPRRIHARQVTGSVSIVGLTTPRTPAVFDWNYQDQNWAAIKPAYQACGTGSTQSPIALTTSTGYAATHKLNLDSLKLKTVTGQFYNTGRAVYFTIEHPESNFAALPPATFDGETVYLSGFHFHTPSEHTVNGAKSAAEAHFVFYNATGAPRAVMGIRVDSGSVVGSPFITQLPLPYPTTAQTTSQQQLTISLAPLFLEVSTTKYWTYRGSLTTPGCSEGLRWFVLDSVLRLSSGQLSELQKASVYSSRNINTIKQQQVNV